MQSENERGRDEMNLAEFPIGLLSERTPAGLKTLVFGNLTITGSDIFGLPTPLDTDVIVALLYLTKTKNNFTNPTVEFTRYEILNILGMHDKGQAYKRLEESLRRWVGVTLYYQGNWWDNSLKCRVDASFHILDDVTIFDRDARKTLRARATTLPPCTFTWGRKFFESCRADNIKRLDLGTYFSLRSAISKQLYRFLDKRFYVRPEWTFDLRELAFGHVGLSRNYSDSKIKEKLKPALEELRERGFLGQVIYFSPRRGEWRVTLTCPGKAKALGSESK
jgi:hypothetical protein